MGILLNSRLLEILFGRSKKITLLDLIFVIKDHLNGVQIMRKKLARIKLYPSRSMVEMEEFLGLQFDVTPLSLFPKSNQRVLTWQMCLL